MTPGGHELESQKPNKSGGANTDTPLPEGYRVTELGPLPEEWRVVRLGEVAIVKSGGSAPQGEIYFLGGKHPFVRVQHLDVDTDHVQHWDLITDEAVQRYHLQKFPAGTIVFPKSGASIRLEKRAMLLVASYIVSHLCAVLPKVDAIERLFLFYSLKAKRLSEDKADGYPVLNLSEIREVPIPLPPFPEQRAIAHVLRAVQRAREASEGVITALRELKKSLMEHLFTYGPVPVNATGKVELQETEIGQIPVYWQVVRLGEVAIVKSGGSAPQGEIYFLGGKHPFVRVQHLDVDTDHVQHWDLITDEAVQRYHLQKFPAGTIVFPKSGASIRLEKRAMLLVASYIVSHLCAVLPKVDEIERLFLFYSLKAKRLSEDKADGYPVLNLSEIREVPIPLPPLSEQHEIAHILQKVDHKIEVEHQRKAALEALFKALLHDLMTAKRRLPAEFVAQFEKKTEAMS